MELQKLLEKQSGPNIAGDYRTLPTTDTSASPDDVGPDQAWRKSPPELDGSQDATAQANLNDIHPLFPNVDPAYRTTRVPQVTERAHTNTHQNVIGSSHVGEEGSPGGISPPRQATQWSRLPNLESRRPPFWQDQPPRICTRQPPMPHPRVLGMFGNIWMTPAAWVPRTTTCNMMTTTRHWGG